MDDAVNGGIVARPIGSSPTVWIAGLSELNPVRAGKIAHCLVRGRDLVADQRARDVQREGNLEAVERAHILSSLGFGDVGKSVEPDGLPGARRVVGEVP